MIRINDDCVQLNHHEQACAEAFSIYLDEGFNIPDAVANMRLSHDRFNRLTPEFISWVAGEVRPSCGAS